MSLQDHNTFSSDRRSSSSNPTQGEETDLIDFIYFLAKTQELQVDLLSVAWQAARENVGWGGTSEIKQALIDLHTSFAFKKVSEKRKSNEKKADILRDIIQEISVLSDTAIRKHPQILELQGVCWDISPQDCDADTPESSPKHVWPVLVFEKSQFGDLRNFAALPVGRGLGMKARLKICRDVGMAIASMHGNNIIHGDVKPENILIFKNEEGQFAAKVTDFGYSTLYIEGQDGIMLSRTRPWDAPEYDRYDPQGASLENARRTDIFSFGLLCFWLLFEVYLSGEQPLPVEAEWAQAGLREPESFTEMIQGLKDRDELIRLSCDLITAQDALTCEEAEELESFFHQALKRDPFERPSTLDTLLKNLGHSRYLPPTPLLKRAIRRSDTFQLQQCILALYNCDFRVRYHIVKSMKTRISVDNGLLELPEDREIAFQLALCSRLGFGTPRDLSKSDQYMLQSGKTEADRAFALDGIGELGATAHEGTLYQTMRQLGRASPINYGEYYLEQGILDSARAALQQDVNALRDELGEDSTICIAAKRTLSSVVLTKGALGDGCKLECEILDSNTRKKGPAHPDTLISMLNLGSTHRMRGDWREAEELISKAKLLAESTLEINHALRVFAALHLARVYRAQGKRHEAKDLLKEVATAHEQTFGPEHPRSLTSKANLAAAYRELGLWSEAEVLQAQVVNDCETALGTQHPDWLSNKSLLSLVYLEQRKDEDAETTFSEVMKQSHRILGPNHPDALTSMANMASTYQQQGRWEEARKIGAKVVVLRTQVLGPEHPSTLLSKSRLGSSLSYLGQLEEAEEIQREVVEARKSRMLENEQEHPDTIMAMANLAATLVARNKLKEAEDLFIETVAFREKLYEPTHPETIVAKANLAATIFKQGRFEEAKIAYEEVLQRSVERFGWEHKETLVTCASLGTLHRKVGKLTESELLLEWVISTRERLAIGAGRDHIDHINTSLSLGLTYEEQGRLEDAEGTISQVCERFRNMFGTQHPSFKAAEGFLNRIRVQRRN